MRRSLSLFLVAAATAFALTGAVVASAAPVSWAGVDVTLHQDQDGPVMLVAGTLPDTVALPADVELSVPASSTLMWIGEILGGDTTLDPDLKYTKTTAGGIDTYHVTLTKSRTAQIEASGASVTSADGATFNASLQWSPAQAVPSVRMTVVVPAGARIVTPADGATLQPGDATSSYYYKIVENVKAGTKLDLTFSYAAPTVAGAGDTKSGSNNTLVIFLAILLLVAAIVVAAVAIRIRMSGRSAADEDDERS